MSWQHWIIMVLILLGVVNAFVDNKVSASEATRDVLGAAVMAMLLIWGQQ